MLPFRKIVFPVDYSDPCQAVVPYVDDMVRQFSAGLTLVHAYGPGVVLSNPTVPFMDPKLPEKMQEEQEWQLRAFAREFFPTARVSSIAELGEPGGVIDKVAQQEGADLIML